MGRVGRTLKSRMRVMLWGRFAMTGGGWPSCLHWYEGLVLDLAVADYRWTNLRTICSCAALFRGLPPVDVAIAVGAVHGFDGFGRQLLLRRITLE